MVLLTWVACLCGCNVTTKNYRWYTTLETVKDELGITDTLKDEMLKRQITRASDFIELFTERTFIPVIATKTFDIPTEDPTARLYLHDELIAITSLSDDDGVTNAGDYKLYPLNDTPKTWIQLTGDDSFAYTTSKYGAISIAGSWGYCNDTAVTGTVLAAAITSTTATTFTVIDGTVIKVGYSLLIDTEQLFVSGVSGTTITVVRGNNGTTAATHLISTVVSYYVVPSVIELAASNLAGFWHLGRDAGNLKSKQIGDFRVEYHKGHQVPSFVVDSLRSLRRMM